MARRILLKISGEAFSEGNLPVSKARLAGIANDLRIARDKGVEIAVVVGGGNFLRGSQTDAIRRITGDQMAILATLMNGLALRDHLDQIDVPVKLFSAVPVPGMIEIADIFKARTALSKGKIVIFSGGVGLPFVTTDSGASQRAVEMGADVILKATKVDGIYDKDPHKFKDAKLYQHLNFTEVLQKELAVMDLAAFCQCRDYNVSIQVFNLFKQGALLNALLGGQEGTIVSN